MIFREFLPGDPLPTPVFCRKMAKIVQLLTPPKYRFSGGVIRWGHDAAKSRYGVPHTEVAEGTEARHGTPSIGVQPWDTRRGGKAHGSLGKINGILLRTVDRAHGQASRPRRFPAVYIAAGWSRCQTGQQGR